MVRNLEKLELATYYRKRGFSYTEIAKICDVSKSTVSNWLAKKAFSKRIKQDNVEKAARDNVKRIGLLNKARSAERQKRYSEAVKGAKTEYRHYKNSPLFIAGMSIYVSVADHNDSSRIRLSSQNTDVHRIFIKFLCEFCGLTKSDLKCWLLLPEGVAASVVIDEWSKKIKLSKSQFGKTQFIYRNKNTPLHNGTGNTIIGSTVLKHKLDEWSKLVLKEL